MIKDQSLNERDYGDLVGLNKKEYTDFLKSISYIVEEKENFFEMDFLSF